MNPKKLLSFLRPAYRVIEKNFDDDLNLPTIYEDPNVCYSLRPIEVVDVTPNRLVIIRFFDNGNQVIRTMFFRDLFAYEMNIRRSEWLETQYSDLPILNHGYHYF